MLNIYLPLDVNGENTYSRIEGIQVPDFGSVLEYIIDDTIR